MKHWITILEGKQTVTQQQYNPFSQNVIPTFSSFLHCIWLDKMLGLICLDHCQTDVEWPFESAKSNQSTRLHIINSCKEIYTHYTFHISLKIIITLPVTFLPCQVAVILPGSSEVMLNLLEILSLNPEKKKYPTIIHGIVNSRVFLWHTNIGNLTQVSTSKRATEKKSLNKLLLCFLFCSKDKQTGYLSWCQTSPSEKLLMRQNLKWQEFSRSALSIILSISSRKILFSKKAILTSDTVQCS